MHINLHIIINGSLMDPQNLGSNAVPFLTECHQSIGALFDKRAATRQDVFILVKKFVTVAPISLLYSMTQRIQKKLLNLINN